VEPQELLDLWKNGDEDALEQFMAHRKVKKLREQAVSGRCSAANLKDGIQIAYVTMLECLNEWEDVPAETIWVWLGNTYYYRVYKEILRLKGYQRHHHKWIRLNEIPLEWVKEKLTYEMDEYSESVFSQQMLDAIQQLSKDEQTAIVMHYDRNMTPSEIGKEIKRSTRAVQFILYGRNRDGRHIDGALDKLRQILNPS